MAKPFKASKDPELYAATPPLEAFKTIISIAATIDKEHQRITRKIMVNDISRAYFSAKSDAPTFVEICEEDRQLGDDNMCGELNVSMYGTRGAAQNWQRCVSEVLTKQGFVQAKSSPCLFWHPVKDISTLIHGDEFVSTGTGNAFAWLEKVIEAAFEITSTLMRPEDGTKSR